MSDPKRGGSRDISELKQRLGLKKATTPTAGATAGRPSGPPVGGVVPPPGLAPPPPPQPVIPNAAEDPFAAMNAMAAVGTVQRAPEIVIVNDGKPVENVGASSHGGAIAKLAAHRLAGAMREHDGLWVCSGILFNHESERRPRLRQAGQLLQVAMAVLDAP